MLEATDQMSLKDLRDEINNAFWWAMIGAIGGALLALIIMR